MTISRRRTLALMGGGTVLAATAAGAGFAFTRTPTRALAPWDAAGDYADPRVAAMSWALLAPNPHNRQPWMAELIGSDAVAIHRDPGKDLPITDPFARQLTIGMGCFLELMDMAAAQAGFGVDTTLFPDGEGGPVALCRFHAGSGLPHPLFAHVMERRSHKDPYEARPVEAAEAAALEDHATIVLGGEPADALRRIAHDAWRAEAATPAAWQESIDLLRIGRAEIEANPDGIDAGGPMLEALNRVGIFTREAASDPGNPGSVQAIEDTAAAILSAPAFAVQVSPGNERRHQIEVGRSWLRLNLAATGAGLALRPVSQALQEYAEVEPHREAIHELMAPDGGTVQMLGLLGHGERPARTPRWPIEAKLMDPPA